MAEPAKENVISIEEARKLIADADAKASLACKAELDAVLKKYGFSFLVTFQGEGTQCQSAIRLVKAQ